MGIYSDGKTYGINFLIDGESVYKKVYEEPMTEDEIREVKVFFDTITDKNTVTIYLHVNCCSTYDSDTFKAWFPASLELLEELFTRCSSLC